MTSTHFIGPFWFKNSNFLYKKIDLDLNFELLARMVPTDHRRWRPCTLALRKVKIHGNGFKLSAM
jgi:hypothetical protein